MSIDNKLRTAILHVVCPALTAKYPYKGMPRSWVVSTDIVDGFRDGVKVVTVHIVVEKDLVDEIKEAPDDSARA